LFGVAWGAFGQANAPTTKISGYGYLDYFNDVRSTDPKKEGLNGFQIRRLYFTYDYALKPHYKARFRLETNDGTLLLLPKAVSGAKIDKGALAGVDANASVVGVFVKDAYLQYDLTHDALKAIHPSVIVGIQSTPAFGGIEEEVAWKYRSLEKTILDWQGIVSSRDLGLSVKGYLDAKKEVGYWVLVGNDTTKPETNKHKRFYGLLSYQGKKLLAELYGDLSQQPNDKNRTTAKGLLGYQVGPLSFSGVVFNRWSQNARPSAPTTQQTRGVSLFGRYTASEQVEAVGRVDRFDPDTEKEKDATTLIIAGVAYHPIKEVDFIPNVRIEKPQEKDATVTLRTTIHYRF